MNPSASDEAAIKAQLNGADQRDTATDQRIADALDALMRAAVARYPHAGEIALSIAVDPPKPDPVAATGRAGGLARARSAIRAPDGRFLSSAEIGAVIAERSERAARGGRARAARARRAADGTFLAAPQAGQ